jgi:Flp pilus assembly protein TadD
MKVLLAKLRAWFARSPAPRSDPVVVAKLQAADSEAQSLCDKGIRFLNANRLSDALPLLQQAVEHAPGFAEAHFFLGVTQKRLGRMEEARDSLLLATCFKPAFSEAYFYLGVCAVSAGDAPEAETYFRTVLVSDPDHANAHNALGTILVGRKVFDEAERAFREAIRSDAEHVQALSNLGCMLITDLDRADEGVVFLKSALQLAPDSDEVLRNWTMSLLYTGDLEQVIRLCNRLLDAHPDAHKVRLNRALALLRLGEFSRGWSDYEARRAVEFGNAPHFPGTPEWHGEALGGRTILLHAEQGLGDQIMFASCIPGVAAAAGECVIECDPRLEIIFRRSFPGTVVVGGQCTVDSLAALDVAHVDYQLPLGSLPLYTRNLSGDFPRHTGYLSADPARVAFWRDRMSHLPGRMKVAISWRGGTRASRASIRSISLHSLLPILSCPGTDFISLQYTDCGAEISTLEDDHGLRVYHWPEVIADYDETAAIVGAADLVISVTTSLVHLAGALNRDVWILAPAAAEWPFGESGETMPWYPSARIFRQTNPGDWRTVIDRVAAELGKFELSTPNTLCRVSPASLTRMTE